MAVLYKRLTSGYSYEKTATAVTGREIYIRHDDAAGAVPFASLPVINTTLFTDPDGNTASNCLCQKITGTYVDSDPNTIQYEFEFTTNGTGGGNGQPGDEVNTDPDTRRYVMGGESVTIDNPDENGWWWSIAPQNPIRQPISKVIVTGSFTIPKGPLTAAEDATFWGVVIGLIGKINDAAFDGGRFRQGSVLFEGIDGGTVYNDGVLNYQYNMNFSFRIINDNDAAGNPIAADDWNYLWREDNAGWDRPSDSPGGFNYLYASGDFSTL